MKLPVISDAERLPPLYEKWVHAMLGGAIPREEKATCGACPVLTPGGFHPETKCCTYLPHLPNFLVGSALADPQAEATIRARIERAPHLASPLGLLVPREYLAIYQSAKPAFGRVKHLRCPHFDAGGCSVWAHRNGVCATWFCGHNRPLPGLDFWEGLRDVLGAFEDMLSIWVLLEMGFAPASLERAIAFSRRRPPQVGGPALDAEELDGVPSDAVRATWRSWTRGPEALYREAHLRVAALSFEDVWTLLDAYGRFRVDRLRARYEALVNPTIPRACTVAEVRVEATHAESFTIMAERDMDTLEVPSGLLSALAEFRQGDVARSLAQLAARGTPLSDELVQELFDYGVLRPVED
jgi:hypothetical protein